jgi:lipopolysaccharide transport system permease protein
MKSIVNVKISYQAFREILMLLTRHRQLTFAMARREIADRYAGQSLGILWAIIHPIVIMGVYVFIFAYVIKMKVGGTQELPLDYTAYLLSGLIPWMCFQESMSKASVVIVNNANLVKQVVFPIEVLPVKVVIASLFSMLISLVILMLYVLMVNHSIPRTYLLLPVLLLFQMALMIGINYMLSAIGAYFRDVKDFVQIFNTIGLYLVPIFYLPDQVPSIFRPLLYCNPFSYVIWCYQDILYFGRVEHWWSWLLLVVITAIAFLGGYRIFRKLKTMFGNVL